MNQRSRWIDRLVSIIIYRDRPRLAFCWWATWVMGLSIVVTVLGGKKIDALLGHDDFFYQHFILVAVILTLVATLQGQNLNRLKDILRKMRDNHKEEKDGKKQAKFQAEYQTVSDVFRILLTGFRLFSYGVPIILVRLGFSVIFASQFSPQWNKWLGRWFFTWLDTCVVWMFLLGWLCIVVVELTSYDYRQPVEE
jgi:hypothetical protein